jgi:hypothetical protein
MTRIDQHRDPALEERWTDLAAARAGADCPERLTACAATRADRGPVRDFTTRDFGLEALEELADARNYLVWWLQQLPTLAPADAAANARIVARDHMVRALGLVALAYEHAERAREIVQAAASTDDEAEDAA